MTYTLTAVDKDGFKNYLSDIPQNNIGYLDWWMDYEDAVIIDGIHNARKLLNRAVLQALNQGWIREYQLNIEETL